ncbi:hypothetical protein EVAR_53044_1 [Eumeta japonica]|uniref:Mutator-like transposase domain-containing protein n=1 Tax=Eumeta variegata TaxID=151549 RepID=A0A4C1YSR0_EUMVA|nr:hypothetical protein EVAR_53044_1 [Eumeta japonica]
MRSAFRICGAQALTDCHSDSSKTALTLLTPVNESWVDKTDVQQTSIGKNIWQNSRSIESAEKVAKRERDAAIAEGRISKEGIPIIDVYADACWSSRSYGNNYRALSGAAAIVGRRFVNFRQGENTTIYIKSEEQQRLDRTKEEHDHSIKFWNSGKEETSSKAKLVQNILYKSNLRNIAAIAHGVENEELALQLAMQEK